MPQDRAGRPFGRRSLNLWHRLARGGGCLLVVALVLAARPGLAQEDDTPFVLDTDGNTDRYLLTIAGTVGSESFQGVQGLLTIAYPPEGSANPYLIIEVGFPAIGLRNTFYWNSQEGPMTVAVGRVRSRLVGRGIKQGDSHFYYLSPALFRREGVATQQEGERIRHVEQTALPTKIFAQDGEFVLTMGQGRLTGRVVMSGLDPVGHDYVRYAATFVGQRSPGLKTKR